MKYIFLIGTEHQLLQVDYAIKHFKILPEDVVLLIQEININDKLYCRIKSISRYGTIHWFKNWKFIDLIYLNKKHNDFIEICNKLKSQYYHINFFTSHYSDDSTLLLYKILKPLNFYLMDEGTSNYLVVQKRNSISLFFKTKTFIKFFIYKTFLKIPTNIIYFTRFNFCPGVNDQKVEYIVEKIQNNTEFNTQQFGFLGSSVVELKMMDEKYYLFYLEKIACLNSNKQLLYFKHRKEDSLKLSKIKLIGFQIIDLNIPFEKYFSSQTCMPRILSSFYTTSVLVNISENFARIPKLEINVFPLNRLKKQRLVYTNILTYLKKDKNINIIYND